MVEKKKPGPKPGSGTSNQYLTEELIDLLAQDFDDWKPPGVTVKTAIAGGLGRHIRSMLARGGDHGAIHRIFEARGIRISGKTVVGYLRELEAQQEAEGVSVPTPESAPTPSPTPTPEPEPEPNIVAQLEREVELKSFQNGAGQGFARSMRT